MEHPNLLTFVILAFCYGAMVGSFLNVVIYRLPRMARRNSGARSFNLGSPRSTCPQCGTMIAFYDNIPIFSYFVLRARCRHCRQPIPARYVCVELLVGTTAALLAMTTQHIPATIAMTVFLSCLFAIGFIYYDKQPIPRSLVLIGLFALLFFLL